MKQLYSDLWQTSSEQPVPGEEKAAAHAYLLLRESGNILFYNTGREAVGTPDDAADLRKIEQLGGITHQLLGHWHEASPSLATIRERFGAILAVHEHDSGAVERHCRAPDLTFKSRQILLGDIEIIPTPGHTAGSTCFLYRSPVGGTYLFTGDTIVPKGESGWLAFAFEDDDNQSALRSSLALLREFEPDVVLAAGALGDETHREIAPGAWPKAVDEALAGLD